MKLNEEITNEQFEWTLIFWGMVQEGCSVDEALGYILVSKCPTEIYSWLVKEVKSRRNVTP